MRKPTAVLVYNPVAGKNRCDIGEIIEIITENGYRTDVLRTHGEGTIELLREHLANRPKLIVSAGGDGTLHLVANAAALTNIPVLVIPCGTANDLAGSLALPSEVPQALALAHQGATRRIDLGWVNGRYFINVASLGMSARVAHQVNPRAKRRFGRWAYVAEAVRQSRKKPVEPLRVCIGGECHDVNAYQVSIANGERFGGGWRVSDRSKPDDAQFDVAIIEANKSHRPKLPFRRSLEPIADTTWQTAQVDIDSDHDLLANLDGEPLQLQPPLHFRVFPGALQVFAPQ